MKSTSISLLISQLETRNPGTLVNVTNPMQLFNRQVLAPTPNVALLDFLDLTHRFGQFHESHVLHMF